MTTHKVFVYGTLKRGEPNHNWITDPNNGKAVFLGNGKTKKRFPLIIGTRYNIPFLLYGADKGHNVLGEIYEVDEAMLGKLDELEDHPTFYERQIEEIQKINSEVSPENFHSVNCWVYFLKNFRPELLNSPMLQCYQSKGDHGLPYLERYLREPGYSIIGEVRN
ncbi:hypothetical protein J437_LFUL016972 [Ladona fulva]|uniref:Gamma-glutamylcyclotransferase family protein n=1 Tax=Ladona fulva TaxID=123851 RepID=A0A8K0KKV5_LADFU|nr:hypothetical protein J437_LFUL016972 [Ladona fulva]